MTPAAPLSRRTVLRGVAGGAAGVSLASLTACRDGSPTTGAAPFPSPTGLGTADVTTRLTAQPVTLDLGGTTVATWAYGDTVPGPLLRVTAGQVLRVDVANRLPEETSVHWHGIALRNDMDGVPGVTQDPIAAGGSFRYQFTAPDPGTYFYHPHTGVQVDRGLYGVLVVDDPDEPGAYDDEWVVVLDDWVDGTGRTPDEVLADLQAGDPSMAGTGDTGDMGGMDMSGGMGSMGGSGEHVSDVLGGAGDVDYPHYLVNGRTPADPVTLRARPGDRVRVRIVNAATDTAFRVVLGGHRLRVTHSDGWPAGPVDTPALMVAMGERYDVVVTLRDGVFPLVASAEGKDGQALAVVRTAGGTAPTADASPAELRGPVLLGTDLTPASGVRLDDREPDRTLDVALAGSMATYRWTINGKAFPDTADLPVSEGERVRLRFLNHSMMFHPMHLHGHTFGLVEGGARKDTVVVRPMRRVEVDLDATNPGAWMLHCHNLYHAESGMMTMLSYRS